MNECTNKRSTKADRTTRQTNNQNCGSRKWGGGGKSGNRESERESEREWVSQREREQASEISYKVRYIKANANVLTAKWIGVAFWTRGKLSHEKLCIVNRTLAKYYYILFHFPGRNTFPKTTMWKWSMQRIYTYIRSTVRLHHLHLGMFTMRKCMCVLLLFRYGMGHYSLCTRI